MKKLKNITTLEEHFKKRYGKIGTKKRTEFERKSKAFMIGEMIKEQRHREKLTQEELAKKAGTKKSYISRIENGQSDIQLTTLFKIIEQGLGRRLRLTIRTK
jgi:HTH-type transcriptional regulator / antitoxin HipB